MRVMDVASVVLVAAGAALGGAEMLCGRGGERPLSRLHGGSSLVEFTLSLWLKTRQGCAPLKKKAYPASAGAQWHEGCALVSGVFRDTPTALWRGSDAAWRNASSGNDFGLSLAGDGVVLFGVGYRHVPDLEGRGPHDDAYPPPRDTTIRSAAPVTDGNWRHVAATRSAAGGLRLYVDGVLVATGAQACCLDGAAPVPAAYAAVGASVDATSRRGCCDENGYSLEDAPDALAVGQLYAGCLRAVGLDPVAATPAAVAASRAGTALPAPPAYPLYFVAAADVGSREMRDAFVGGLKDGWDLREFSPATVGGGVVGASRWLTKMRLALRAVDDARSPSDVAVVSDLDIAFYRPVAPLIERALARADIAFQRDSADKRDVNLGFFQCTCWNQSLV